MHSLVDILKFMSYDRSSEIEINHLFPSHDKAILNYFGRNEILSEHYNEAPSLIRYRFWFACWAEGELTGNLPSFLLH